MISIYLYWFSLKRTDNKENFGDLLSHYIVKNLTDKNIKYVKHPSMRRYKYFLKHYLTIGSILEVANEKSIVWGSGIIRKNDFIKKAKFLAVRGPRTRKRLLELGYHVPPSMGDPSILLSDIYRPNKNTPMFDYGIIPHYEDFNDVQQKFKGESKIKVIDLITNDVEQTINEILDCKQIISSSLHGIIVPHTYGIPALWVIFSDKLGGDKTKFYDYFESVNLNFKNEFQCDINNLDIKMIDYLFHKYNSVLLPDNTHIQERKTDLYKSNPFS
jgi:hypothetical protein